MRSLLQDMRYAVRVLGKSAGSTTVALLTLALAIGANTAIFSVVYAVLLQPLPYREPDRLVTLRGGESALNLADFAAESHTLSEMGGFGEWPLDLTGAGEPRSIPSALITGALFETLGTKPMLGRTLTAADDQIGGARLVVASYGFWQSTLNSNPQAVGSKLTLSGVPYTLVGVMPPGFGLPRGTTQLWVPLKVAYPEAAPARNAQFLYGIGRMRDHVQLAAVQAEVDAIGKRLSENYPADNLDRKWHVVSLQERVVGKVRLPLLILLASVACILLIACGNLAGLVLAKAVGRRQEIAVRGALGATRFRIVRQLLSESLLLSLAGGAAGVLVACLGLDLLLAMKPEDVPRLENVGINSTALLFTLGISLLAGILFGLAPAFQLSRSSSDGLNLAGRVAQQGFRRSLLRRMLVVAEIAMALVLLTGAGLLTRSFWKLSNVDPGFHPDHLVTLSMQLPVARYGEIARQESFFAALDRRVLTVPGVESAAIISELPLGGSSLYHNVVVASQGPVAAGKEPEALAHEISPGYFATMGIALLQGRDFNLRDDHNHARVAIVSQGFVREQFKGKNPIGERIRYSHAEDPSWYTIVGVAADTKHSALDADDNSAIYTPLTQKMQPWKRWGVVVVKPKSSDTASLIPALKQQVWSLDPQLPLTEAKTMDEVMASSVAQRRFSMTLLGLFAGCALSLAIVGIYGVLSYLVTQRTREIGIRMALGAQRSDLLREIAGEGGKLVLLGIAGGMVGSFMVMRVLNALLFEIKPTDPLTFILTAGLLAAIAMLASYLPARRASRIDPMTALHYE
jgi:putative ABC transport system permease protein